MCEVAGASPRVPVRYRAVLGCRDPAEAAAADTPITSAHAGTVFFLPGDHGGLLCNLVCLPQLAWLDRT